jgi:hypothetical protein
LEVQIKTMDTGAQFFSELFDGVPVEFLGSVLLESGAKFYVAGMRFEYVAGGFQTTSVPAEAVLP